MLSCTPCYTLLPSIYVPFVSYMHTKIVAGAVLEISLSSFQSACLSRTSTLFFILNYYRQTAQLICLGCGSSSMQSFQWRCNTNFCEGLQFSFVATKKRVFTNFESKQRPVSTTTQPAVYASWNVVAEKGRTHRQGKILSGFWKPRAGISIPEALGKLSIEGPLLTYVEDQRKISILLLTVVLGWLLY